MAKPRSRELDYLVYLLLRLLICVIQALPFPLALWLADGFAWLAYRVDRRHRKVAEENLLHTLSRAEQQHGANRDRAARCTGIS